MKLKSQMRGGFEKQNQQRTTRAVPMYYLQCAQGLDKIAKTNGNFYEPRLFLYRNNALLKRIDA
jgi:hypothetical protein